MFTALAGLCWWDSKGQLVCRWQIGALQKEIMARLFFRERIVGRAFQLELKHRRIPSVSFRS